MDLSQNFILAKGENSLAWALKVNTSLTSLDFLEGSKTMRDLGNISKVSAIVPLNTRKHLTCMDCRVLSFGFRRIDGLGED